MGEKVKRNRLRRLYTKSLRDVIAEILRCFWRLCGED